MDLDLTLRVALLVLLIGGLGLVLYVELRYMRKRNNSKIDVRMMKDEAYNGIVTTRAVARVLKERGTDTSEADLLLLKAEGAYGRGEYLVCNEAVREAKASLERAKPLETRTPDDSIPKVSAQAGETARETAPFFEETKKLPENYLQSKFMISSVRSSMEPPSPEKDLSEVEKWLDQAESSFKAGEYTEAFKYACKAKKAFDTTPVLSKTADKTGIMGADLPDMGGPEHRGTEVGVPRLCTECGAELSEDDLFCGRCGARVRKVTRCPSCGAEAQEGDRFCRKCGSPLN